MPGDCPRRLEVACSATEYFITQVGCLSHFLSLSESVQSFGISAASLIKQIRMRTGSGSGKNQLLPINRIDEHPIWFNVTFTKAYVTACECVIMVTFVKLHAVRKLLKHIMECPKVITTLLYTFVVLFEL